MFYFIFFNANIDAGSNNGLDCFQDDLFTYCNRVRRTILEVSLPKEECAAVVVVGYFPPGLTYGQCLMLTPWTLPLPP